MVFFLSYIRIFFKAFSSSEQDTFQNLSTESSNVQFNLGNSYSSTASMQTLPVIDSICDKNENVSNPFDETENKDEINAKPQSNESELKQLIINNTSELRNLWVQLYHTSDGVQFTTKSINKFRKIYNSISGRELVDWLIQAKSVSK